MKTRLVVCAAAALSLTLNAAAGSAERPTAIPIEFPVATPVSPRSGRAPGFVRVEPQVVLRSPVFHCACSWGRGLGAPAVVWRNGTHLPDPVATIAAAYLQSRSVQAVLLDPDVVVDSYPPAFFGSWVRDGILITHRRELTEEMDTQQVFALLVEAIAGHDPETDLWFDETGAKPSQAAYLRSTGFMPEMIFEFTGELPLRVGLNTRQGRLLIQAGDRWEVYALDQWSGAALKAVVTAPAKETNVTY
jgi:hypothetical protein